LKKKQYKKKWTQNHYDLKKNPKLLSKETSNLTYNNKSTIKFLCDFPNCHKNFANLQNFKKHKNIHLKKLLEKMFDYNNEVQNSDEPSTKEDFILNNKKFKLETNIMSLQSKIDFLM